MRILLVVSVFLVASLTAFAQDPCRPSIQHAVKKLAENNFSIALQSETQQNGVTLQLVDLFTDKVVQEKKASLGRSEQTVFANVKPSVYAVVVKAEGCKIRTLGGMYGIKVGSNE